MRTRVSLVPDAVEIDYRLLPRWWKAFLAGAGSGLGAIALGPDHVVTRVACAAFAFVVLALMVVQFAMDQHVRVTAHHLLIPKSRWSREEVALRFDRLSVPSGGTTDAGYIEVREGLGEVHTIWEKMLPSEAAFERLCHVIRERAERAHPT